MPLRLNVAISSLCAYQRLPEIILMLNVVLLVHLGCIKPGFWT